MHTTKTFCVLGLLFAATIPPTEVKAQSVCLPAPRLMTTVPMGGQVGTTFDVTITGENFEDVEELSFSHPGITATPRTGDDGIPVPNQFVVTVAPDCPLGLHEARVMTRLGVSSSRAFTVGNLPEVTQTKGNTSLTKAMPLPLNAICNGAMTKQTVDFYSFKASQGERIIVDCVADPPQNSSQDRRLPSEHPW